MSTSGTISVGSGSAQRTPPRRVLMAGWGSLTLTSAAVAAAAAAAAFTLWGAGLSGPLAMQGSARGTALVLLALAVPTVAVSAALAWRGSTRAIICWAGGLAYLLYNAVLLLLLTPFNRYFLIYVGLLSTSLWALVAVLRAVDVPLLSASAGPGLRRRTIAGFVLVVVVLNALAWLGQIVPALTASDPTVALSGTGVMTNAVWIQDLAVWLPVAGAGAIWLWRRATWGLLVVGAMLVYWVLESASVAVDQWFGASADPQSTVVSMSVVPVFATLGVLTLLASWHVLHHLDRLPGRTDPG